MFSGSKALRDGISSLARVKKPKRILIEFNYRRKDSSPVRISLYLLLPWQQPSLRAASWACVKGPPLRVTSETTATSLTRLRSRTTPAPRTHGEGFSRIFSWNSAADMPRSCEVSVHRSSLLILYDSTADPNSRKMPGSQQVKPDLREFQREIPQREKPHTTL